jgi:hypothetical protein
MRIEIALDEHDLFHAEGVRVREVFQRMHVVGHASPRSTLPQSVSIRGPYSLQIWGVGSVLIDIDHRAMIGHIDVVWAFGRRIHDEHVGRAVAGVFVVDRAGRPGAASRGVRVSTVNFPWRGRAAA